MEKRYKVIPNNFAECPVCNGFGLVSLEESEKKYSWNKNKTHKECRNCGGQTMYGRASGITRNNPIDNIPCIHKYSSRDVGRCLTEYTCQYCSDKYNVDSGD